MELQKKPKKNTYQKKKIQPPENPHTNPKHLQGTSSLWNNRILQFC